MDRLPRVDAGPTELYRHFDKDGGLLYVGISLSAVARLVQHKKTAGWADLIATITIEVFPTREEALMAEGVAILRERPRYNVAKSRSAIAAVTLEDRIRATINGTRYDNAIAELVASAAGGEGWHIFHEHLFRTPLGGQYFFAGRGGPLTAYARRDKKGHRSDGEAIIPLTADGALEWAVASCNVEAIRSLQESLAPVSPKAENDQKQSHSPVSVRQTAPVRSPGPDVQSEQPAT